MNPLVQKIAVPQRPSFLPWSWFSFWHLGRDRGRTQGQLVWAIATILIIKISTPKVTRLYLSWEHFSEWMRPTNFCCLPVKIKMKPLMGWMLRAKLPPCLCPAPGGGWLCWSCVLNNLLGLWLTTGKSTQKKYDPEEEMVQICLWRGEVKELLWVRWLFWNRLVAWQGKEVKLEGALAQVLNFNLFIF